MIVYFADRQLNIFGHASTNLPKGLLITSDLKAEDVETGVATFECKIPFTKETRKTVEKYTEVGNYILRNHNDETKLFQIIDAEIDTKKQTVYIYTEDDGMDLLNEVVGEYEADKEYPIDHYINMYAKSAGFVIGINEAQGLSRKLSWDGESTAAARIASVATQFDGCEISYSFEIDGLRVRKKYINIHKKRGQDNGVQFRINKDIDSIVTTKSISNLATALQCAGGTPENSEDNTPITLSGYSYDDGDFYVEGEILKSREALKKWSRILWETDESKKSGGHIVKQYSYDTLEQKTLCAHAITELKKIRDMEVNYKVEFTKFPDNVKIGDRVNIIDGAGELYLSARILQLEVSVTDQEHKAVLGEYLIKSSGIHQMVIELAQEFAKNSQSASRALMLAGKAQTAVDEAQDQADAAAKEAANAQATSQDAKAAAQAATNAANAAQSAADNASNAVRYVEQSVQTLEQSVGRAQAAADNAKTAADTAASKAEEAKTAAANATAKAEQVSSDLNATKTNAQNALAKSEAAQSAAATAKTAAKEASSTAERAKADAEQAGKDVDALADKLDSLSQTMEANYTRKTEFTETKADLQSQISQNAAQITSTVSKMETIDETANDAQKQLKGAIEWAEIAEAQAEQAEEAAAAAQVDADNAEEAAMAAQSEADTARAAAVFAKSVADQAQADLEAARADLATITSRVDATQEEIAAAQQAVEAAQAAADNAHAEANEAAEIAAEAQSTADAAVTNALTAKLVADNAASQAVLAKKVANEAKGDASEAQAKANEAVAAAEAVQETADNALANAQNAQTVADAAAAAAETAQEAADDADAKAVQAAADLAAAQQNLADVTSRVDATEEEVEAAQAAVATAQTAAVKAQEEAQAAQAIADTATANAAAAQTAADHATTAANEARAAAYEAWSAADKAKAIVEGLAVRVTDAETKIRQNSEQIALAATKTEVAKTLGGYLTKKETTAAITLESDAIKSSVSEKYSTKEETNERITTAETLVQQLSNCIAMLVTDENGESLMTQTESGWTFSMKETDQAVSGLVNSLQNLQQETGDTKATVDVLRQAVSDHGKRLEYVHVTTYEGEPCIELGESDSNFKLLITNTRIMFMNGSNVPTYINTNGLVTQNIEVRGEIVQGGYVMMNTSDGGWGLLWKGVSS